jgi:pyruvate dehydrogenase E2 component (dihydrolipoamide acetyltransferase)
MNASLTDEGIRYSDEVNIGVAVDTERGLLVPVLRNVPDRTLLDVADDLWGLIERARSGKSKAEDFGGATFTITNLGMYGIDAFTPIINLPECAILGIGRIARKPVEKDGELGLGYVTTLSLTFDHRLVDGAPAARFLQRAAELIANPNLLLLG